MIGAHVACCFWRRQKPTIGPMSVCLARVGIVSREAHDVAGEAPAFPRSCRSVFIQHEEQYRINTRSTAGRKPASKKRNAGNSVAIERK